VRPYFGNGDLFQKRILILETGPEKEMETGDWFWNDSEL
jgi:hypothetical protein